MNVLHSLASGAVGASALTLLHEAARQVLPEAPRVDLLGMRAIARSMREVGKRPPSDEALYGLALVGDLTSNALYYGLVGAAPRERRWRRGLLLGLGAGIGTVVLPPLLGLGQAPSARTPATAAMTVAWYVAGGLAAAATAGALEAETR